MTTYSERLLEELRAVGFSPAGFNDGQPVGDWEDRNPLVVMVCLAHIPDEATYLSTNLIAVAAGLHMALESEPVRWAAYLGIQTSLIRTRRREAYVAPGGPNDMYHEMKSDGATDAAAKSAAATAKQAIQAMIPWPGDYR